METKNAIADHSDWETLEQVTAYTFPFDRTHDVYQEYYRASLTVALKRRRLQLKEKTGSLFPSVVRQLCRVKESYRLNRMAAGPLVGRSAQRAAELLTRGPLFSLNSPVGQYVFRFHGFDMKVALDSTDPGAIARSDLLSESDVYFKTNYRRDMDYPSKVHPLPNANPLVLRHLGLARSLRCVSQDTDLFAFFRVWGGKDEVEGIEHNIALFELLDRVHCKKQLIAYLICGDIDAIARRLQRVNVTCRTEPMPLKELWTRGSRARLHIVRHGMHDCVPWRMTDVLALGGCPVLDFPMSTKWPHPLVDGRNYLQLNAQEVSSASAQEAVSAVEVWLRRPGLVEAVRSNNVQYFEDHLNPGALGKHICNVVVTAARTRPL